VSAKLTNKEAVSGEHDACLRVLRSALQISLTKAVTAISKSLDDYEYVVAVQIATIRSRPPAWRETPLHIVETTSYSTWTTNNRYITLGSELQSMMKTSCAPITQVTMTPAAPRSRTMISSALVAGSTLRRDSCRAALGLADLARWARTCPEGARECTASRLG
jgi:hypothetical protein